MLNEGNGAVAEVDGHIVNAVCVHDDKIGVSRLRDLTVCAWWVTKLYAKSEVAERGGLEENTIPPLQLSRSANVQM